MDGRKDFCGNEILEVEVGKGVRSGRRDGLHLALVRFVIRGGVILRACIIHLERQLARSRLGLGIKLARGARDVRLP